MEQFLITVIIVLVLALVLIIHIVRLIFRFSHPFSASMIPVRNAQTEASSSSGGSGVLIIILILGLAYLTIKHENGIETQPNRATHTSQNVNIPVKRNNSSKSENGKPSSRLPSTKDAGATAKKRRVIAANRGSTDVQTNRYNQSPSYYLPDQFHAIQINAFNEKINAKKEAKKLSLSFNNIRLIFLKESTPFKLIIGPFPTAQAAKAYQQEYKIKGFVRSITLN